MEQEQMKNIVVLKNLPSNIIDEAFVILKSNTKIKSLERVDKNNHIQEEQRKEDDYIVREAEMVINFSLLYFNSICFVLWFLSSLGFSILEM